jgi:hypothetical protein
MLAASILLRAELEVQADTAAEAIDTAIDSVLYGEARPVWRTANSAINLQSVKPSTNERFENVVATNVMHQGAGRFITHLAGRLPVQRTTLVSARTAHEAGAWALLGEHNGYWTHGATETHGLENSKQGRLGTPILVDESESQLLDVRTADVRCLAPS